MLFNSFEYAIFLPLVFILYWLVSSRNINIQNLLLLISSYIFYAFWDWRFLFLLIFVSVLSYSIALFIQKAGQKEQKKKWLIAGISINLLVLAYFKYFNFFVDSFIDLFTTLGISLQKTTLEIILPIGISFYIFLSLSYIIDVYWEKLKAEKNLIDVLLTLGFFPILLAGPIQRPITLLPQIKSKRIFHYQSAVDGLRQILWGLFKKIVIADNAAVQVNYIFNNYESLDGSMLLLGAFYYAFQIYGDFSGYSDIAIGTARLLGFNLMQNFNYPYFSKNIGEFWKKWHISLSGWLNEYLFLPISYSLARKLSRRKYFGVRADKINYSIAITVTFFLCGLWHGANWTFIIWGLLFAFYLIFALFTKNLKKRFKKNLRLDKLPIISILITFTLTSLGWIFFRADNLAQAFSYIERLFSVSLFTIPERSRTLYFIIAFVIVEWLQRNKQHGLEIDNIKLTALRWSVYYLIIFMILNFSGSQQEFIYFQF
jgi:alginate O-acetyltransferase complex protein AlgI